ncbi:MAG: UbiA family prenyltransferase [Actinomycetota bacterium]
MAFQGWKRLPRLFASTVRAEQWWEYKLIPTFCCFYGTAVVLNTPIASLWQAALALLLALAADAVYVSITNDIADREIDAAAGKVNRTAAMPGTVLVGAVAIPLGIGSALIFHWRHDPWLLGAYLAAWIVFTIYSVPPFRLKTRGLPGVLADAAGAHLFPALVAVLLVYRETGSEADPAWLAAIGAWAFGYGLRGILWHQLEDLDNDLVAGVGTFAVRQSPSAAIGMARYFAFPLEIVALAVLLWKVDAFLPVACLAGYILLAKVRVLDGMPSPVIVEARGRHTVFLHEYYDVLLPAGILISSATVFPVDMAAIAFHLLVFPLRASKVTAEIFCRLGRGVRRLIHAKLY